MAKLQAIRELRASEPAVEAETVEADQEPEPTEQIADHCCHHHTDAMPVVFGDDERRARTIYDKLMSYAKAIVTENPNITEEQVIDELVQLLSEEAEQGGYEGLRQLEQLIEDPKTAELVHEAIEQGHDISDALTDRIRERTNLIVTDYSRETREAMRAALENTEQMTAKEIQARLEQAIPANRAYTIARNETVYAFRSGRLEADMDIATRYGFANDVVLTWRCTKDANTCDLCAAMDGTTTKLGRAYADMVTKQAGTELPNGHVLEEDQTFAFRRDVWNDHGLVPSAHVNCRCYFDEDII
jgi:hypothetical protein